jgi:hypothetical protein
MLDREDADLPVAWHESIKRHVPCFSERDHQFPKFPGNPPAEERVGGERLDGRTDSPSRRQCDCGIVFGQKFERALDVEERSTGINYLRHGFGRGAFLPRAKRSIQAWTSSAR